MLLYVIDDEITLKSLGQNDADELFQLTDASREFLREWLAWVDETKSASDSLKFIESATQSEAGGTGLTTGILYKEKLAGVVGFNTLSWTNRIGHIGYWLGQRYQASGIMTRATKGIIDYGFNTLGLNRVEIHAAYGNNKSRAIPERLGFVKEGQKRQAEWLYDHYVDHVMYSMLASEWKK